MLDFETSYGIWRFMSAWINEWCKDVKNYAAANGAVCNPVVYTEGSIARIGKPGDQLAAGHSGPNSETRRLGLPLSASAPGEPGPFGSTVGPASVPGVYGGVNVDVLNGSATTLQALSHHHLGHLGRPGCVAGLGSGKKNASPGSGGTGNWDNGTANWWLSGTGDVAWHGRGLCRLLPERLER